MNGEKISGIFLLLLLAMPFAMGTKKTASNGNVMPSKLKARRGHFKPPAGTTVIHIPDDEDGLIDKQQSGAGQEFHIGSSGLAAQPNVHVPDPNHYNYEMVEKWLNEPLNGSPHAEKAHPESPHTHIWSPKSDPNDRNSGSGQLRELGSYRTAPTKQAGIIGSASKTHEADYNSGHNNYAWLEAWLSNGSPYRGSPNGESIKNLQNGSSGSAHLKEVESNGSEKMTQVGTIGSGKQAIHESPSSTETAQSSSQSQLMNNMLNHHQTSVPFQKMHGLASSPTSPEQHQWMDELVQKFLATDGHENLVTAQNAGGQSDADVSNGDEPNKPTHGGAKKAQQTFHDANSTLPAASAADMHKLDKNVHAFAQEELVNEFHDYHDHLLEQRQQQWRQLEQQLQQQEQIHHEKQQQTHPQLPRENVQLERMGIREAECSHQGGGKAAFHPLLHKPPHSVPKTSQHLYMPIAGGGGDGHRSGVSVAGNHQKVPESTGVTAAIAGDAGKQNKVPIIQLDDNSQFGPLVQAMTGKKSGLSNSHQQIHDFNMPYVQVPQTIYVPKRPANGGDRRSAFFRANRLKVPTSTGAAPGGKQTKPLRILHEPVDIQIHLHDKSQLGKLVQKVTTVNTNEGPKPMDTEAVQEILKDSGINATIHNKVDAKENEQK